MRGEGRWPLEAGIDVTEGDYRWNTWERRRGCPCPSDRRPFSIRNEKGRCSHLSAHAGVPFFNELLSKTSRTLSTSAARKGAELPHGEVAGEHRDTVEKASLGIGIPELLDALKDFTMPNFSLFVHMASLHVLYSQVLHDSRR